MALKILWAPRAAQGYGRIIEYLETQWTLKEVESFKHEINTFLERLADHPKMLTRIEEKKNYHRGPINKHTMLTYRVNPQKEQIELVNIRGTKQEPLK